MEPFFRDYLDRLESLHNDLKAALDGLEQEALDWSPGAEMNSLCVMAVHVCGSERFWLGDVVAGEPSNRDRPAEFRTQGLPAEFLRKKLDASLTYARRVLEPLTLADLQEPRLVLSDNRQVTVGWALAHVLGHTGLHAGHAQVTREYIGR